MQYRPQHGAYSDMKNSDVKNNIFEMNVHANGLEGDVQVIHNIPWNGEGQKCVRVSYNEIYHKEECFQTPADV